MCRILLRVSMCVALCMSFSGVWAQSLWQAKTIADGTPYSDKLARKSGDLLTIAVRETTTIRDNQKTETSSTNDKSLSGSFSPVTAASRAAPGLTLASERDFKSKAKTESRGDVRATITARVTGVLDNGNLVIEGRRSIKVNEDIKTILITGIIRSEDISSENVVASEKMHNFRIAIDGEGPMTKAQQEGLFSKIFGMLWPF